MIRARIFVHMIVVTIDDPELGDGFSCDDINRITLEIPECDLLEIGYRSNSLGRRGYMSSMAVSANAMRCLTEVAYFTTRC
jgi:hypothetical protein